MTALSMPVRSPREKWLGGNMPIARLGLIVNLAVPGLVLAYDAIRGNLGANAINFATKTTGLLAVSYLVLSLVVTPLRAVTGLTWLTQFRRAVGCWAAYFAIAHLAIYVLWERGRNLGDAFYEITHRWYLIVGIMSLLLMLPLLATSFNAAIRAMGGRWWKRLHRLAYLSAALGVYHFWLQSKADKSLPNIYAAVLGVLLLWRVGAGVTYFVRHRRDAVGAATGVTPGKARFWKGPLKVVATFKETPDVTTFRLAPPDGGSIPFAFKAGQFLSLAADIDGMRTTRSYTIASPPTRDAYVEISVKRERNGKVSAFLHDKLMSGHTLDVSAPAGRYTFDPASADRVTLVAGGVGITPNMAIVRDLTDRGWRGRIDLLYVAKSPADFAFDEELRFLEKRHDNLHVHRFATRDTPPDFDGRRGRLMVEAIRELCPNIADGPAHVCGPDAMAEATRAALLEAGVPEDRVVVESFTPAASVSTTGDAAMAGAAIATATFTRSHVSAPLAARTTILEAAESVGVAIDYQCRSGICGTCRCKLLSGTVTMDVRDSLSEKDERDGYILACQARAEGDVTIDA
jgi:glycine betaine catabolism B